MTTAGAKRMLQAAISEAERLDISVTVAIVDGGGHLLVLERVLFGVVIRRPEVGLCARWSWLK